MVFSYNWLQSFFKKKLPKPQKLAELLTMKAFEVTEVKKSGKDWTLDIDVLPNRASDCFSHLGIAREIAAITGLAYRGPTSVWSYRDRASVSSVSVEVKDKLACPRYTAQVVMEVKVGPSPKWLRERLELCGLQSINNVVDVANYVMLETGQPLHAFDGEKLEGKKIIVRLARKGEKIITLDNQKFDLDQSILVIADAKKPVAIAGIKGGKGPGIDIKTKTVVLESANFNPRVIRRGSQKLGLKTDASLRFEHGLDPNLTELAINRAAYLIQELARGKISKDFIDVYPKKVYPKRIKLDLDYVKSLLGEEISKKEIMKILRKLEFKCIENGSRYIVVEVPTFRLDVSIPEDLIEEIGRLYGYEKIPVAFPLANLVPPKKNAEVFWENMIKDILKEQGFVEVYNYSFVPEEQTSEAVQVLNPISSEYKYLRTSLVPGLFKNIQKNIHYFPEIRIFELGKVFRGRLEKKLLAGAISPTDFYYLKGVIDLLLEKLGISNVWYEDYGRKSALIKVDGQNLGCLTENSFELDFNILQKFCSEEHEYRPLSKFPAAVRDLAVLVPLETKVAEVLNLINAAGGPLVRDVDLFDIYEGEELPEGKKNLAFHIVYQSDQKTLTSDEVDKIHWEIIKTLEKNPEWQVRK